MSYEHYQKNLGGLSIYLRQSLETLIGQSEGTLFVLSEHLKELDGKFIQSLLNKDRLVELMKLFCVENKRFVFDGEALRATADRLAAVDSYEAGKILTIEELLQMTDLEYLFSINAYDFPHCKSKEARGVYEHFFDFLLKKVIPPYESSATPVAYQYHLLVESIPVLRVMVQEWFGIINCVARIFQNITTRCKAFDNIKASLVFRGSQRKDDPTIDEIVRWFEHAELQRQKDEDINDVLKIVIPEPPPHLVVFLESTTAFKAMMMTKLISTEGKSEDRKTDDAGDSYLAKVEYYHHTLFSRIVGEIASGDTLLPPIAVMMIESSKVLFEKLKTDPHATAEAKEFCERSLLFFSKFEDLVTQLKHLEGFYLLALAEGRKLMEEVASAEAVLAATRFRSTSVQSPRPGSGGTTPTGSLTPRTPRSTTPRVPTPKVSPREKDHRDDLTLSGESILLRKSGGEDGRVALSSSRKFGATATPTEKSVHRKSSGGYSLKLWGDGTGSKSPSPAGSPATSQRTPRTPRQSGTQSPLHSPGKK